MPPRAPHDAGMPLLSRSPRHVRRSAPSRFITGETGNNVTPYIENLIGREL